HRIAEDREATPTRPVRVGLQGLLLERLLRVESSCSPTRGRSVLGAELPPGPVPRFATGPNELEGRNLIETAGNLAPLVSDSSVAAWGSGQGAAAHPAATAWPSPGKG